MSEQIGLFGDTALSTRVPSTWSYQRRRVPQWAAERSLAALVAFNDYAGMRLQPFRHNGAPSEHLTRITGAVLDHPDVTDDEWRAVCQRTLSAPWWDGPPTVGVVFGPRCVDRNIAAGLA